MRKKTSSSSKYYGVIFRKNKTGGTWIAQIGAKRGRYRWYGGCFSKEKDAARAVVTEQIRRGIGINPTLAGIAVGVKIAAGISRAADTKADKSEIDRVTGLLRKDATMLEYENGYRLKCIDSSGGTVILNLTDPAERESTGGIMLSAEVVIELIGWLTRLKSGRGKRDQSKE